MLQLATSHGLSEDLSFTLVSEQLRLLLVNFE